MDKGIQLQLPRQLAELYQQGKPDVCCTASGCTQSGEEILRNVETVQTKFNKSVEYKK